MIRQDRFEVGDKVEFIQEDDYIGTGMAERHRAAHGKGPYVVEEVDDIGRFYRMTQHTQWVTVNGETYSGYWFKPVHRDQQGTTLVGRESQCLQA